MGRLEGRALETLLMLGLLAAVLLLPLGAPLVRAQGDSALAAQYAPELHFTNGEQFYPTSVGYIIGASTLMQRNPSGQPTVVSTAPTPSNLGSFSSSDLYLNNNQVTQAAIAADYAAKGVPLGYFSYVHIVNEGSETVIQYWLFYAYNNGQLNDHQGDIEVVEVFLSSGTPQAVLMSQHFAGENAAWADVQVSQGTHPVVYVAQGSHANYFRPYQGKIGIEDDVVSSDGLVIAPDKLTLVTLGEKGSHSPDQSWLDFPGRWGYWGTDLEVAQGKAGPLGPVFNQDGIRWGQPDTYLTQTFPVSAYYFDLAYVAANFLLIFLAYTALRAGWKVVRIIRRSRKGTLAPRSLLKGRLGIGVALVIVGVLITVAALFLPWYSISSSSASGPLGSLGKVDLLKLDGIDGLRVNFFEGSNSDASSGFSPVLSTQVPFAIIIASGIVLLFLDLVGFSSGKRLGMKFVIGAISSLVPFILIYVFLTQLPSLLPFASQLLPGQTVPAGVGTVLQSVGSNPVAGTATQTFPIVGSTTVEWGFGIGAYLFVVAALVRLIGAVVVWGVKIETPGPPASQPPMSHSPAQPPAEPPTLPESPPVSA